MEFRERYSGVNEKFKKEILEKFQKKSLRSLRHNLWNIFTKKIPREIIEEFVEKKSYFFFTDNQVAVSDSIHWNIFIEVTKNSEVKEDSEVWSLNSENLKLKKKL